MTPFRPADDATSTHPAGTVSARVSLKRSGNENTHVQVCNAGASLAFIRFGDATVVSNAAQIPLPAGAIIVFDAASATHLSAVTAAGATTLYATCGKGL